MPLSVGHDDRVGLADVVDRLAANRDLATGSGPWTRQFLDLADQQFERRWRLTRVPAVVLREVRLPRHAGEPCQGDTMTLVPTCGLTAADAGAHWTSIRAAYTDANPCCAGRLEAAERAPFSLVIVTTAPLDTPEHRALPVNAGGLYHLDGLHRLIAWAAAGRLNGDLTIPVAIAG